MVAATETVELVPLDSLDLSAQTRAALDETAVAEYAQRIVAGEPMDPGRACRDSDGRLVLACGYHRLEAYRRAGFDEMPVIVCEGSRQDALLAGVQDNRRHVGVRLTRADRREAARKLLLQCPEMSDRTIAGYVGVDNKTVAAVRRTLESTEEIPQLKSRVGGDGRSRRKSRRGETAEGLDATPGSRPNTSTSNEPRGAEADIDRCKCGATWESDGHGGRFCLKCGSDHPGTPSLARECGDERLSGPRDTDSSRSGRGDDDFAVATSRVSMSDADVARRLCEFFDHMGKAKQQLDAVSVARPGPHYERATERMNAAEDVVNGWVRLEGVEDAVFSRRS